MNFRASKIGNSYMWLSFGSLMIVTLTLKFNAANNSSALRYYYTDGLHGSAGSQIAAFLTRQGFDDSYPEISSPPAVVGQTEACRVLILAVAPQGWHRDLPRQFATTGDRTFFIYHGTLYNEQPVWLTRAHFYRERITRSFGLKQPIDSVLGVVASPRCKVEEFPWNELGELAEEPT